MRGFLYLSADIECNPGSFAINFSNYLKQIPPSFGKILDNL